VFREHDFVVLRLVAETNLLVPQNRQYLDGVWHDHAATDRELLSRPENVVVLAFVEPM